MVQALMRAMVQAVMQAMRGMIQAVMQVMVQVVMRAMGSDGEWQMKLRSLAHHSPPAVQPGS